jgi:hypothetical protein
MDSETSFFTRLLRGIRNVIILSVIVGLGVLVAYQMSLVNSRTYALEIKDGNLHVLKGTLMPKGFAEFAPSDARLAMAYAPLPLNGNAVDVVGKSYEDRDALDHQMFAVIETLAKPRLTSDVPKDIETVLQLLGRADCLDGLTSAQRDSLKSMKSSVAFFVAKQRLEDSRKQLEEALSQLKLAAEADNKRKDEAKMMLLAVEPQVKLLAQALRTTSLDKEGLAKAMEGQLKANMDAVAKALTPEVEAKVIPVVVPQEAADASSTP